MSTGVSEQAFEAHIADWLVAHGYYTSQKVGNQGVADRDFDPVLGLDATELFTFIGATQPKAWATVVERHGGNAELAQQRFKDRLAKQLDARGTVDVLRRGVTDQGIAIALAYFLPASGLNQDLLDRYNANRLTVVRQFAYAADSSKTVDLALLVNGLLVATAELKNHLTGQSIEDAVHQYRHDRDPKDVALSRRAVVHFALDTELVQMTTRLAGPTTRFLPFNRGRDDLGAGNPPNPGGHRTAYLWERVWRRDAWLDLIARFIHIQKPEGGKGPAVTIFPRFHQWDAVRTLEAHAKADGAGHNYLVQHSAGSGKSNTIAWLSHRLASLHSDADEPVFDKVVIITDRRILDRQLQETVFQFEHTHGVVVRIDQDSAQLADALSGPQARIIITTLQKFPFVLDKIDALPSRRYAVVVDEAHSSQTGDAARDLKLVLADAAPEEELSAAEAEDSGLVLDEVAPAEDALAKRVAARRRQPNLSFFAFTATPKGKTLELFGTPHPVDGRPRPFHLYPMRQAIEEGFILDVLANYTTYETYWRISKAVADDPEYATDKARAAIARFVSLHAINLSQRASVIVEHFRQQVAGRIGGRAKAMVVTSSRLHAVRYARALREYIDHHGYGDSIGVLVAFSGTVADGAAEWTESALNGFPESQTAQRFDGPEFRILVVAEKYQTGFDQPKLYAMYVDRTLSSIAAVQTLSRLNRTMEGKDGTVVIDFRNEAEDIQKAFEPYYGATTTQPTDPNQLHDSRAALDEFGVLRAEEIERLTDLLLEPPSTQTHARVSTALQPAVDRFHHELEEERQEAFRDALNRFVRTYAFLSQLVSFGDPSLERDYLFGKALARLIRRGPGEQIDLGDEVELSHLRQDMTFQGEIALSETEGEVRTIFDGEGKRIEPEQESLSSIIATLNERFGLNLTEADRLHVDAAAADLVADEQVQQQAAANSPENFRLAFEKRFDGALLDRHQRNEDFTIELLNNPAMRGALLEAYLPLVYGGARVAHQQHCPIGELIARDEDAHLERKATFGWDIVRSERSKAIEAASLKTIAAFLNSAEGGTLLIGVSDAGEPVGMEPDYLALHKDGKNDADVFELHLMQAVLNAVGVAAAERVKPSRENVAGLDVWRVHVHSSSHPVEAKVTTVDSKGQHVSKKRFYVRIGNGTREITDDAERQRFIAGRWTGGVL